MKNILLFCAVCLAAYHHYTSSTAHPAAETSNLNLNLPTKNLPEASQHILNIVVNDISGSDAWLSLTKSEILALLLQDSCRSGSTQLAGICIDERGEKQTPFLSAEMGHIIQSLDVDIYEEAAARNFNKKSLAKYQVSCRNAADSFARHIILPRNAPYSNVNGALGLSLKLGTLPNYQNYLIRLIILSDLLQDMPNGAPIGSFVFPPNTVVYVIGSSDELELKRIFPANKVVALPAFKALFFSQS